MGILFLDLETTGLNKSGEDEILEIGIIDNNNNVLMDQLIKPDQATSWPDAERVNHISPDAVKYAPSFSQVRDKFSDIIHGNDVAIYNARFELSFLPSSVCQKTTFYCVMEAYSTHRGFSKWAKLEEAVKWANGGTLKQRQSHRAVDDARDARLVWNTIQRLER